MKQQDGNGSTVDLDEPVGPDSKKPQKKTVKTKAAESPASHNNNKDPLREFFNTEEFPVDMNAEDAEALFKAYMAKIGAGLRT